VIHINRHQDGDQLVKKYGLKPRMVENNAEEAPGSKLYTECDVWTFIMQV
jgi:hypothetical protein